MDDLRQRHRRRKKELLDPSLGRETRAGELTAIQIQEKQQNKIPGIVFKGMFLAMAMTLLPFFPAQAPQFIKYANARGLELINLFLVGLAVSYGVLSRRPDRETEKARNDNLGLRLTEKYVSKMFEFGGVFDDSESVNDDASPMPLPSPEPAIDGIFDVADNDLQEGRSETWNSSWRPEEALTHIVDAENGTAVSEKGETKRFAEKPLLLPIRSLKSSLSNPDVFDFLYETEKSEDLSSKPEGSVAVLRSVHNWNPSKSEVRNGELRSVESGNLEQNIDSIIGNDEAVVFPSPIPWSSRSERLDTNESQPAFLSPLPVENLSLNNRKLQENEPRAVPSPIPWSFRPDASDIPVTGESRPSDDGRPKKNMVEKSDSKPPLPPPASPVLVENRTYEKNLSAIGQQPRSEKPVQKAPTPRPSPCPTPRSSPPRPHPAVADNGSAQKDEIKQRNSDDSGNRMKDNSLHTLSPSPRPSPSPSPRPSPSPPSPRPTVVGTGSAPKKSDLKHRNSDESSHVRKDDSAHKTNKEAPVVAAQDLQSGKSEKKVPTPSIPNPSHCPVVGVNGSPEKNGSTEKKNSNHRNDDGSRNRNIKDVVDSIALNPHSERKQRKVPSPPPAPPPPPPSASVVEGLLSHNEQSEADLSHGSELRYRNRDGSSRASHSRHSSRDGSSHLRHSSTDVEPVERRSRAAEFAPRLQSENIGRKAPSPPPSVPPPPPPIYPDVPSSGPLPPPPPPPPFPMDEEHQQEINSSADVVVESVDSHSEIEEEIVPHHGDTHFGASPDEVDQKADAFIAKFHEQIRLQRVESIRHYKERLDRGH